MVCRIFRDGGMFKTFALAGAPALALALQFSLSSLVRSRINQITTGEDMPGPLALAAARPLSLPGLGPWPSLGLSALTLA